MMSYNNIESLTNDHDYCNCIESYLRNQVGLFNINSKIDMFRKVFKQVLAEGYQKHQQVEFLKEGIERETEQKNIKNLQSQIESIHLPLVNRATLDIANECVEDFISRIQ